MFEPWYKTQFTFAPFGKSLKLSVPHDVFSTQRIDEGTILLLENLPKTTPKMVLDMGCGYGALGLPIAAKFPEAKFELVDRDLLAAEWSQKNALSNELKNVDAHGSLGFRDVKSKSYDWILCNVPARIGRPFIQSLMEVGASMLTDDGEMRVVVITDLGPVMKELQAERAWKLEESAIGPRHTIFTMKKRKEAAYEISPMKLYLRDEVNVADLKLARPFDIGGDDQKRLKTSLPILIDSLPRRALPADHTVLIFRASYGALPLLTRKRWADAYVVAVDRDLLGTTFLRANAEAHGLAGPKLEVREQAHFPEAIQTGEKFDLIIGELSPSAGEIIAIEELRQIQMALKPSGEALILCLDKMEKDWVRTFATRNRTIVTRMLTRESYSVIRITAK